MSADHPLEPENPFADAIDAAEDIHDSLKGLVETTAIDPGAPFAPDALVWLATLKKDERAAFEALRSKLKQAGCRVTELDKAIGDGLRLLLERGPCGAVAHHDELVVGSQESGGVDRHI